VWDDEARGVWAEGTWLHKGLARCVNELAGYYPPLRKDAFISFTSLLAWAKRAYFVHVDYLAIPGSALFSAEP
jgi:hypothetical protein